MPDLIRLLWTLRWASFCLQLFGLWLALSVFHLAFAPLPLILGAATLLLFNLWLSVGKRLTPMGSVQNQRRAFLHLLFDIVQLTWMISWSGGAVNPFTSLLLVPIVLAAPALSLRWMGWTAAAAIVGYAVAVLSGASAPVAGIEQSGHGRHAQLIDLHLWGMAVNFVLSAGLLTSGLIFLQRRLRTRDQELAKLRVKAARDEGILGLATHAAAMAHSLNTPLATLTLAIDELCLGLRGEQQREAQTALALVDQCRDRVRELVHQADPARQATVMLDQFVAQTIDRWQLLRPEIELRTRVNLPEGLRLRADPALAHLLQAMLDNAADASLANRSSQVSLRSWVERDLWHCEIEDDGNQPIGRHALAGRLQRSTKSGGMGIGLALSHATVEQYGGQLRLQARSNGARAVFQLPVARLSQSTTVGERS